MDLFHNYLNLCLDYNPHWGPLLGDARTSMMLIVEAEITDHPENTDLKGNRVFINTNFSKPDDTFKARHSCKYY